MRRLSLFAFAAAASLAVGGCGLANIARVATGGAGVPPPSQVASHTSADEEAMRGAELLYKGWRTAIGLALTAGQAKGERAAKLAEIDNRLFSGLKAVRGGYRAFNSASFKAALESLNDAAADAESAVNGSK